MQNYPEKNPRILPRNPRHMITWHVFQLLRSAIFAIMSISKRQIKNKVKFCFSELATFVSIIAELLNCSNLKWRQYSFFSVYYSPPPLFIRRWWVRFSPLPAFFDKAENIPVSSGCLASFSILTLGTELQDTTATL